MPTNVDFEERYAESNATNRLAHVMKLIDGIETSVFHNDEGMVDELTDEAYYNLGKCVEERLLSPGECSEITSSIRWGRTNYYNLQRTYHQLRNRFTWREAVEESNARFGDAKARIRPILLKMNAMKEE
jgi:hypothetical protein